MPCLLSILPDHRLQQEPLLTSPPTYLPVAWRLQPCMQPATTRAETSPYARASRVVNPLPTHTDEFETLARIAQRPRLRK